MSKTTTAAIAAVSVAILAGGLYWANYEKWVTIPKARALISDQLKDPGSTQFRNDRITKQGWLCGELNSKNGNGGYVGFKRYISGSRDGSYSIESQGSIGKESTDEYSAILQGMTAIMKNFNEMKSKDVSINIPPEHEIRRMAIDKIFEDKWNTHCVD